MRAKHAILRDPELVYAFVDLEPAEPAVYLVPSEVVADVLSYDHAAWLQRPGVGGRAHQDNILRRLRPEYPFPAPGFEGRWLDRYRDRWDLLRADESDRPD